MNPFVAKFNLHLQDVDVVSTVSEELVEVLADWLLKIKFLKLKRQSNNNIEKYEILVIFVFLMLKIAFFIELNYVMLSM